ncbi:MAG: hypothetical protein ACYC7H_04060 [Chloroflexota bacterium]
MVDDNTVTLHPLHLVVWAGIEELLKGSQLAGLIALGRAIANAVPGSTMDEQLQNFEGGSANREVLASTGARGMVIRLKHDIFTAECCGLPWSKRTGQLLERYNGEVPRGGGASHPLHIVMHEVHRGLGQIVDIGTRDLVTGSIALSQYGLERCGMSADEATALLKGGPVLYCICE